MKIRAIRVAETGPFVQPVAVEGFSGGFDILSRPNETGKSTLFAALGTLITEKHTSTARAVTVLRPDSGGAPLIEADLELEGGVVRLRKRFLASKSAELTELESGRVWRGADAETEIERRLGGEEMRALRGLVWVPQGASFALPDKPDAQLLSGLADLIEREAADSAGSGAARRLAAVVRERLGELVTAAQNKAKAGSALHAALRQRDEISAAFAVAEAKASSAEARRHKLDALRLELRSTANADAASALTARSEQAAAAVSEADRARASLRMAEERLRSREFAVDKARSERDGIVRAIADAVRLNVSLAAAGRDIARLQKEREGAEAELRSTEFGRAALAAEAEVVRGRVRMEAAAERERTAREASQEAERRLVEVREVAGAIEFALARIAANPANEEAVTEVQRLSMQLASLEAQVAAQAPRISIAYASGGQGRLSIDGRALDDGWSVRVERAVDVQIDGVGTLRIEPAHGGARTPVEDRDEVRDRLAERLAKLGASSVEAAHAGLSIRRRDEATVAAERKRVAGLAPQGIEALHRLCDGAATTAATARSEANALRKSLGDGAGNGEAGGAGECAQVLLTSIEQRLADAIAAHHAGQRKLDEIGSRILVLEAGIATETARAGEAEKMLGAPVEREAIVAAKEQALAEVEAALSEAVRERSAWAEKVPAGSGYDTHVATAATAAAEVGRYAQRQRELEQLIAEVAGAMRRDGEEGAGAEVAHLAEALAAAEERVGDLELDVQALQLLAARLAHAGESHRSAVLRPVIERLRPLLARLLPGAELALDGPLLVARLEREGRADTMARLSGGTREQVATLVRVAYAQLLAEQGRALPLVLDDALVYSDDPRLEAMIEVLAGAASRHQVVLLSCHQRAIGPLAALHRANCLEIEPWNPEGAVARVGRKGRALSSLSV